MNERIDQVIHKLDALMNGAQPGDTEPPPFVPDTMDAMRAVVKTLVADCRTCGHLGTDVQGRPMCRDPITCIAGDMYEYGFFVPMWAVKP